MMKLMMTAADHPLIVKKTCWGAESATQATAQWLAQQPQLRDALVTLHGDLGAGKTTFARYLLTALGVTGRIKSPTYAVMEAYLVTQAALPAQNQQLNIWHCDFYRFNDPDEGEDAGGRDIFASAGLKLVEWPDKAGAYLPLPDLTIAIELLPSEQRNVTLSAFTATGAALLETLA